MDEKEIPIDKNTIPHGAIKRVIDWLGVGYETTVTQKSDGAKIVIRIQTEEAALEKQKELEMLRRFYSENTEDRHEAKQSQPTKENL